MEHTLAAHPDVIEAAVVGVPDERLGEVGVAYVVPATGVERPSADELIAWCREHMAHFKAPRAVRILEELPKLGTGKIAKAQLREDAHRP